MNGGLLKSSQDGMADSENHMTSKANNKYKEVI